MEVKINFYGGNHVSGWIDSSILTHLIRDESVESIMDNDNGEMLFIRDHHEIITARKPEENHVGEALPVYHPFHRPFFNFNE